MARGRPSKLTPELQRKLVDLIASNVPIVTATAAAGISERTFHAWMKEGRAGTTRATRDFAAAIDKAEAEGEAALVLLMRKAGIKDWRAALELLKRRYPQRWGDKATVTMQSREDLAEQTRRELRMMRESVPGPP